LGVRWQGDVRVQSEHLSDYHQALKQLRDADLIYPCFCTRKKIQTEVMQMGLAPHAEDMADIYPGLCRHLSAKEQHERMQHEPFAWRLDVEKAWQSVSQPLTWSDQGRDVVVSPDMMGDVVIGRKDIGVSYHLAVVVDDALQGITHVIRGDDLRSSTPIHRLLQALLGLPSPIYQHHALLCDRDGVRLAKRHQSICLKSLHEEGLSGDALGRYLLQSGGVWPFVASDSVHDIVKQLGSFV